jgi:hypothetical protein
MKAINSILCISDMGLSYMLSNKTIFYHFDLCEGGKQIWVGGKNGGSVGLQETNIFFRPQESPYSENTTSRPSEIEEREREHVFIRISISNKTPQTINEKENPWGYCLGTVSGKTSCHWRFKPGSWVHQPHTCPNRISYQQTSTSCLDEITPTRPSAQQCYM